GNKISNCDYPVVYTSFFDNVDARVPELKVVNSKENASFDKELPFQFIMLNCTAPYPIEWIVDIPQHYYFSFILDDEVRKISDNKTESTYTSELFTVRLHIGNETLANHSLSETSAVCQAVASETSCGKTVVFIKRNDISTPTSLQINFGSESLLQKDQVVTPTCMTSGPAHNKLDELICTNEIAQNLQAWESHFFRPECSPKDKTPTIQFLFNTSELTLPSGGISAIQEEKFISLCITNANSTDIYVGDVLNITCVSSIYYFAIGMQIYAIIEDPNKSQNKADVLISETSYEYAHGSKGYRNLSTNIAVNSTTIHGIECKAPVRKSRRWVSKTLFFKVKGQDIIPLNLKFDGDTSNNAPIISNNDDQYTFLLCNATGDPLPTLSWSRVYNGKLPTSQNITLHLSNDSRKSWIVSKLYFPMDDNSKDNLTEYYGRYICTAKNKFESLEKVFIFENSLLESSDNIKHLIGMWTLIAVSVSVMIATVVLMTLKILEQSRKLRLFTKDEIDYFIFGKPELLLSDSDSYENINSYAAYLPYNKSQFEIEREQLEFDLKDVLGSGAYGTVYKGIFSASELSQVPVAIKTVHSINDKMYFAALLSEIKMMCYVGKHEHIVNFIGACTKFLELSKQSLIYKREVYVAMEYCENGDLLSYLQENRTQFEKGYKKAMLAFFRVQTDSTVGAEKSSAPAPVANKPLTNGYCRFSYGNPSRRQLVAWGLQIADGMVIHGDLAARNILLTSDLMPKIGDFGLSTQLQNYSNYVRKGDDLVPWKWLAIECLQYMKFSIKSDVWAFGVILFEIFSMGQVPYPNCSYSDEFIFALSQGERLQRPIYATQKVYDLMLKCWNSNPDDRPTFLSLENTFKAWMGEPIENLIFVDKSYAKQKDWVQCEIHVTLDNDPFTNRKVTEMFLEAFVINLNPVEKTKCKDAR
ncbi:Vascular endothelial growth factor receptor 2, partial [Orchesella cincta]